MNTNESPAGIVLHPHNSYYIILTTLWIIQCSNTKDSATFKNNVVYIHTLVHQMKNRLLKTTTTISLKGM